MNNLKVGDVFKWHVPYIRRGNEIKERWFVFLGKSNSFISNPIIAYICTTTTNSDQFSQGKIFHSTCTFSFKAGEYGFVKDCILNLNDIDDSNSLKTLENSQEVEIINHLPEVILKQLYTKIYNSGNSPILKMDIYESYNMSGITGLSKPKKRN